MAPHTRKMVQQERWRKTAPKVKLAWMDLHIDTFSGSNFVSLPYFIFKASMAIYVIGFFGWSLWYGLSRLSNGWKHALYLTHWGYFCLVIWALVDFDMVADRFRSQANTNHVKWFTKISKNPLGESSLQLLSVTQYPIKLIIQYRFYWSKVQLLFSIKHEVLVADFENSP